MSEEIMVDVVTFVDDEGNEFDMQIVDEFEHKGKSYALLTEWSEHEHEDCDCGENEDCCSCGDESLYIFEVVADEEGEQFVAIEDDDLMDELTAVVEALYVEEDEDDEDEEDDEDKE